MKPFNFTSYILNNPLLKESVAEKLKSAKEGETVDIVLDSGEKKKYKRVGTNKNGEPTFKRVEDGKEKGSASALSASHIKSVK
jgi:uncharacterized protein Veg